MADRSSLRSDVRLELGDPGANGPIWTDAELNRAIDEVTADFSRIIPQEKIREDTINFLVVDEGWITNHDTAVSLGNKPIELNSESVRLGFGSHLIFDGVDDSISVTSDPSIELIFDGGGTLEFWIYPRSDGEGDAGRIFDKDLSPTFGYTIYYENDDGANVRLVFIHEFSGTSGEWRSDNVFPLNQWSHVTVKYNADSASNNPSFLQDSSSITVTTVTNPTGTRGSDANVILGIGADGSQTLTFDGFIDEVRMWNVTRTDAEISDNFKKGVPSSSSGLVGYWKFDEGSGTTAQDSTSNNNDGTISGATYGTALVPPSDDTASVLDTDYTMDYANGTITALAAGNLANSVGAIIDYTKSRIALDLSSITDMVAPIKVESMVGSVPQDTSSFFWWNSILWITTSTNKSQTKQGDFTHVRVYYHAEHTAPTDSVDGSFPRFLDQVMIKGAVAYALFIRHRKLNLRANRDAELANSVLADIATARTFAKVALASLLTATSGPHAKAATALDATTTPLADINTALDKVATRMTEVSTALAKDVHITTGAETALDAAAAAAALAKTALDKVDTYLTNAVADSVFITLKNILTNTVFADANTALDRVKTFLDEVHTGAGAGILEDAESVWTDEVKHILTDATQHNMQDDLETGDDLINTVNLGADAADLWRRYALAAREMAQLWDQKRKDFLLEADKFTAEAVTYIQEALARLNQGNLLVSEASEWGRLAQGFVNEASERNTASAAYTAEASQRIAMFQGFINEAQQRIGMAIAFVQEAQTRVQEVQLHYEEADRWFTKGQMYLDEAGRWLQEVDLLNTQAQRYLDIGTTRTLLADKFLSDARERHTDYWELLQSRVQSARQRSLSSPRQYADGKAELVSDSPLVLPTS